MPAPLANATAARLYTALGAWTAQDAAHGYVLAQLCDAVTAAAADVEQVAADVIDPVTGDVLQVGWGPLMDAAHAPAKALPWLGQFVGAVISPALSEAQARALVAASPGRRRGTVGAIKDAARLWLSGTHLVTVNERVGGDAYAVEVVVYAAQVVDLGQLTAAVKAAMPAGLSLTLTVTPGWSIASFEGAKATVAIAEAAVDTDTVLEVETHI